MAGGMQTQVNTQPAPAVAGDFADANPRVSVDSGPGGMIAGASGVTVGRFAWATNPLDGDNAPALVNNFGGGAPTGLVHRGQQGLITAYLSDASMLVPSGFPVTLQSAGGYWVVNSNASVAALPGMKAYASYATGLVTFNYTGNTTTVTQTSATIATGTAATFTGSITGNILTTGVVTNTLYPGALLSGTGVATGTQVQQQITGVAGAAGTYYVNIPQTVASASLTATPYLAAGTGGVGIVVGSVITAASTGTTGTVVGAVVTAIVTAGTNVVVAMPYPGTGTNTTATLTFGLNYETKWIAVSGGAAGELVKMSSHLLG